MATHLWIIQQEKAKGKSTIRTHEATDELAYLITFNQSITQAMARTIQNLLGFVFINMGSVTLLRQVASLCSDVTVMWILSDMGSRLTQRQLLETFQLHMTSLFLDDVISKAEEEISHHEDKH